MNAFLEILVNGLLALWSGQVVLILILAAFCGWLQSPLKLAHCWRLAQRTLLFSMAVSGAVGVWLLLESAWPLAASVVESGRAFGLYPNGLSVWMAVMVSFIGWVILRYADTYLRADPGRDRFLPWLLVIIGSVLLLVTTSNLLILALAWVAISLALHHLLTLYQERPEARLAAVQKFIFSRVGDALIFLGVGLLYAHHGTFVLPDIVAQTTAGGGVGPYPAAASVAFALAAVLKCAQIPFHGWLLRVMEAPTPVSALLHAGVINLGGFLWLRLFPVFEGFTTGHLILLAVGGATAVVAVLTMMTQYSVKHALAWSTCAQMGFMLFEIGMGAYTLALLHLLAHSLYKAHSFLASGRTVAVSAARSFGPAPWPVRVTRAGACMLVAAAVVVAIPQLVQGNAVLGAVLVLAVGAAALGIPSGTSRWMSWRLCALAVALVPCYLLLHTLVAPAIPAHPAPVLPLSAYVIGWLMVMALVTGTVITRLSPRYPMVRRLCTHFRQGLYLEAPLDHLTRVAAADALRAAALLRRTPHHPFRLEERS